MGKESFLRNVGALPAADEIRNAEVVELKDNPGSDAEAGTEQEGVIAKILSGFSDALTRLDKGMEDLVAEVKATSEGLLAANNELSGLKEKIVALEEAKPEPADPEAEAIRIEELVNQKVDKLAEEAAAKAEEAVNEDDRCPECRANVGFRNLPVQKEYGNKVDINKYLFGKGEEVESVNVIGVFRQCPECEHKEPATEKATISEV